MLPQNNETTRGLFIPTADDVRTYGTYELTGPLLLAKPADVPDDYIAYNPSAIWTVRDARGRLHDIMYVRVEPNRSSPQCSHLGKSVVRPYEIDLRDRAAPLRPYYDAEEKRGEDAALARINRRLQNGKLEKIWLLSCVDPRPKTDKPNEVDTLTTRFYGGTDLDKLEHIGDGPEWMKDIRVTPADGPLGTELELYGRPQAEADSGNLTYATLSGLDRLTPEAIAAAPYINENLLPIGSGVWGGVNDVFRIGDGKYILAAHRAWRTGVNGAARHYESVLYGHNVADKRIVELGVIATADMFPSGEIKDDTSVDLHDVAFTGGGHNGRLTYMSYGIRDASIGLAGIRRLYALAA